MQYNGRAWPDTIQIYNDHCVPFLKTLPDESVDMVFADPPFNVGIKYKGYKDTLQQEVYRSFTEQWVAECFRVLKPTGSFYLMTIDKHLEWKLPLMAKHGVFINLIKWKNHSDNHDKKRFWLTTQPIMVYGKTDQYKFNPYAQLRDRDDTIIAWDKKRQDRSKYSMIDYWDDIPFIYAGSIAHKEAILKKGTRAKQHPCQMPEMLSGRPILFSTDEGDTVLDPFLGSGTTAISCIKTNRKFIGCELSEEYFNLSKKRIIDQTHQLF